MYGAYDPWEERNIIDDVQSLNGDADGIQEGDAYPFGATWGGDYVCFYLRKKSDDGEYPLLFWNHEASEDENPEGLWSALADNFADFMQDHYESIMAYDHGRVNY